MKNIVGFVFRIFSNILRGHLVSKLAVGVGIYPKSSNNYPRTLAAENIHKLQKYYSVNGIEIFTDVPQMN